MESYIVHNWARILESHDINSDLHKSNPNYKEGFEWQINCQRCVPTYEMRRRGYNVTALPANNIVQIIFLITHLMYGKMLKLKLV